MASSTQGLVPITRAYLAHYYDKYLLPPLPEDVARLTAELRKLSDGLASEFPLTEAEELLVQEVDRQPAHKVDQNLWKNRENLEEILFLLDQAHRPRMFQEKANREDVAIIATLGELETKLRNTLKILEVFQQKNADHVFNIESGRGWLCKYTMHQCRLGSGNVWFIASVECLDSLFMVGSVNVFAVMTYMPQDFRGTLIRQQKERSERNRQAEVDALVNSGGTIHDRRNQLAQLGSATGVYKTLVKYLVGVPQVLLDFIRQINDDQGPMEEQRSRYGPSLYKLTTMVLTIRLFLLLSWGHFEEKKIAKDELSLLQQTIHLYTSEFEKFIAFIGVNLASPGLNEVFSNSPFFIKAEDAGALESRNNDDYKEIIVPAGKTHEVTLAVESVNSYIAWDFSLIQGSLSMDIGFRIEYVSPSGGTTLILPYRRYESDQGNFSTILTGSYKLIWDNSYSTFFKKISELKTCFWFCGSIHNLGFQRPSFLSCLFVCLNNLDRACGTRWMPYPLFPIHHNTFNPDRVLIGSYSSNHLQLNCMLQTDTVLVMKMYIWIMEDCGIDALIGVRW
ncbi:hypothetical protein ZIOFF_059050 [Zingiber officinale]|uniref:GOLD domain-containing protein n=1 Tax=Zingiber officinale TaxID=94328 RepID=A0A8J5KJU1_ZINOF|nr:hypothetical protein ZIOFF_059050 [Zingiber officinale]